MTALISLLLVLTLSLIVTRVMTVALTLTGIARDSAQFQAASAFSGAGFTTSESESVVNHPVRRRIILLTMRLGTAGVVTTVSSLVLTFVNVGGSTDVITRLILLSIGVTILYAAAASRNVDRFLSRLIDWALRRWTDLDTRDYVGLLDLTGEYRVAEIKVQPGDWLADKCLSDLALNEEGVLILGIYRQDGYYIGAPTGSTRIYPDDTLILYGQAQLITELDHRRAGSSGDSAHQAAIIAQDNLVDEQARLDPEQG